MLHEWFRRYRTASGGGLFVKTEGAPIAASPYDFEAYTQQSPWSPVEEPWAEPNTTNRLSISQVFGSEFADWNNRLRFEGDSAVIQARVTDTGALTSAHAIKARALVNLVPGAITNGFHIFFGVTDWGATMDGYSFVLNGSNNVIRFLRWDAGVATDIGNTSVTAYNNNNNLVVAVRYDPSTGKMDGYTWLVGSSGLDRKPSDFTPDLTVTDTNHGAGEFGVGSQHVILGNNAYEVRLEGA